MPVFVASCLAESTVISHQSIHKLKNYGQHLRSAFSLTYSKIIVLSESLHCSQKVDA
jgi:hypothetical protein